MRRSIFSKILRKIRRSKRKIIRISIENRNRKVFLPVRKYLTHAHSEE